MRKQNIDKYEVMVKNILGWSEKSRDNDAELYYHLLSQIGANPKLMTVYVMLVKVWYGQLPSYDSISRCRRKIQALYPELKGSSVGRRSKLQNNVKNEMKNMELRKEALIG